VTVVSSDDVSLSVLFSDTVGDVSDMLVVMRSYGTVVVWFTTLDWVTADDTETEVHAAVAFITERALDCEVVMSEDRVTESAAVVSLTSD